MARHTGPKNKKARRIGIDLALKTDSTKLARRLNIPPGQHGRKGMRKLSDYGVQLKEKQKVKLIYGILEKQFRRYINQAAKNPAATGLELLRLLERRLDNVVYRLGFAPTRAAARQLVVHRHVTVNGQRVDRPSYNINVDDVITLSSKAVKIPAVSESMEQSAGVASWLQRKSGVGKVTGLPERDHIDIDINENLIVEFYSR